MKSRALPEDFDRSTALHPAFPRRNINPSISLSCGFGEVICDPGAVFKPGHRRDISGDTSASSLPSVFSEPLWTPSSGPGSPINSPTSLSDERTHCGGSVASQIHTSRQTTPYGRSRSIPTIYGGLPHLPTRVRAVSLASPLSVASLDLSYTRHSGGEVPKNFNMPISPLSDISMHAQSHPPFRNLVEYSPIGKESAIIPSQLQSRSTNEQRNQPREPAASNSSFYATSPYSSLPKPQNQQFSPVGFPTYHPHQSFHQEIHSASSAANAAYPWSPSSENITTPAPSVSYPTLYTSGAPYSALESPAENVVKSEEREHLVHIPAIGLGLPSHFFAPREGIGNGSDASHGDQRGDTQGFTHHPHQYAFPYSSKSYES